MSFPGEKGAVFHEACSSHRNEQRPSHGYTRAACGQAAGSFPVVSLGRYYFPESHRSHLETKNHSSPPSGVNQKEHKVRCSPFKRMFRPVYSRGLQHGISLLSVTRLKEVLGSRTANLGDRWLLSALTPSTAYLARLHKKFHRCHSDHRILGK